MVSGPPSKLNQLVGFIRIEAVQVLLTLSQQMKPVSPGRYLASFAAVDSSCDVVLHAVPEE